MIAVGVGPNGAGKTTLFNCINAHLPILEGDLVFLGRNLKGLKPHQIAELGIARTFQVTRLSGAAPITMASLTKSGNGWGRATLSAGCS